MVKMGWFSFIAFVSCLTLGNALDVTSSEAPIALFQPRLAGDKPVGDREGEGPPSPIYTGLALHRQLIQKRSPPPRY